MTLNFDEGERIPIPCRHCASLSIEVAIRTGTALGTCHRCKAVTRITMGKRDDGWSVTTELAQEAPASGT